MTPKRTSTPSRLRGAFLPALVLGAVMLISLRPSASAQAGGDVPPLTPPPPARVVPMSDEACLECHSNPDMVLPLPSGEQLSLTVERILFKSSVHGRKGYACVQCHTDIQGFPHPKLEAKNVREVKVKMAASCALCHQEEYEIYLQGDHARVLLEEGNLDAATCTDCHGAHKLEEFGSSRVKIARTCQKCHADIYKQYRESVHGAALFQDYNPDVPTCVDCHSNHSNAGPEEQPQFHLFSPQICAKCHTDEKKMARYDINTEVFDTFVADFHGTTVTIFEKIAPDQETNKPVCVDCHGVHDILPPEDTDSTVFKQNLLDTCQRCHPDATPNFPDAWLKHYTPDREHNTIVYLVNLFYTFFIPGTIGIMLIFVTTDFWRKRIRRKANQSQ